MPSFKKLPGLGGEEQGRKNAESKANICSRITFWWLNGIIATGYKKPLDEEDLDDLQEQEEVDHVMERFQEKWDEKKKQLADDEKRPPLWKVWISCMSWNFIKAGVFKLISDFLAFVGPYGLNYIVEWVDDPTTALFYEDYFGYIVVSVMFLAQVISSFLLHQSYFLMIREGVHLRSNVIALVYRKSLNLPTYVKQSLTEGKITTLMSVDSNHIMAVMFYIQFLWTAPIQLAVALYLLVDFLGPAGLLGAASMLLFAPVQAWLVKALTRLTRVILKATDERVGLTTEVVQGIRIIKYYAWQSSFFNEIGKVRSKEMKLTKYKSYLRAMVDVLLQSGPIIVALTAFLTYAWLEDGPLTAAVAFTSLSLFNILRMPLMVLPIVFALLIDAKVSLDRVSDFIDEDELPDLHRNKTIAKGEVLIKNGTFRWDPRQRKPTIKDVNLDVREGELVIITGRVGTGKSSLLSSVLGELTPDPSMRKDHPSHVKFYRGRVSYASQIPWILNQTIKQNILFGSPFDAEKYEHVLEASALNQDLETLAGGDETEIGERGINLSGGQKQRVSIARTLYADADIYIFDDPFSSLDGHTGDHVFQGAILGFLKGKTRLLVTHNIHFGRHADQVLDMTDKIVEVDSDGDTMDADVVSGDVVVGNISEVKSEDVSERLLDEKTSELSNPVSATHSVQTPVIGTQLRGQQRTRDKPGPKMRWHKKRKNRGKSAKVRDEKFQMLAKRKQLMGELSNKEMRLVGSVSWRIYLSYVVSCGWCVCLIVLLLIIAAQAVKIATDIWLVIWSEQQFDQTLEFYIIGYSILSGAAIVTLILVDMLNVWVGFRGSIRIHDRMLRCLLAAPVAFFDTTPVGRIINRVSKDINLIDQQLPMTYRSFVERYIAFVGVVGVICYVIWQFAAGVLPIIIVFYIVQQYYRRTSRELKRLDSISKSPIFAHFTETLGGLSTIRAFNVRERFQRDNGDRVDHNLRAYWLSSCVDRWLGTRLDLLGAFILLLAGCACVLFRDSIGNLGLIGLVLSYSLSLTSSLNFLVRQGITTEIQLNSIERTDEYSQIPSEGSNLGGGGGFGAEGGAGQEDAIKPDEHWPSQGIVEYKNVHARYRPSLPNVLKGVSFRVDSCQKIGICGRTGSGKSSLMVSLFRIIELSDGQILIDGLDISRVNLEILRSRMSIIPQDPILFHGSIRSNLDPFYERSDEEIWGALRRVELELEVKSLEDGYGLDSDVGEGGDKFSVGERQLFCMARALLRQSKILVLDEATASVDHKTDQIIQNMLRTEFKDFTVLTIAHRLGTIMDYDRVLVMDDGFVGEYDTPQVLCADPNSLLSQLLQKEQAMRDGIMGEATQ